MILLFGEQKAAFHNAITNAMPHETHFNHLYRCIKIAPYARKLPFCGKKKEKDNPKIDLTDVTCVSGLKKKNVEFG